MPTRHQFQLRRNRIQARAQMRRAVQSRVTESYRVGGAGATELYSDGDVRVRGDRHGCDRSPTVDPTAPVRCLGFRGRVE